METHPVHHIDEGLSGIPTELTDHLNLILVREDCLDERDHFVRREGMTDQAFAGRRFEVDKDGWIWGQVDCRGMRSPTGRLVGRWLRLDTRIDHINVPLGLHHRTTLVANGRSLTIGVERVTRTGGRDHVLVMARGNITEYILNILLLLSAGNGSSILLVEDTEDTDSDLVVDDRPVVFTDNVDTKFLIDVGAVCSCV